MNELVDVHGHPLTSERRTATIPFETLDEMVQEATQSVEQQLSLEDRGWLTLGTTSWQVIPAQTRVSNVKTSRTYAIYDPLMTRSIALWTDYTYGTGMSSMAKDEGAQDVLKRFWDSLDNRPVLSARGQRKSSDKLLIDGEIFFVVYLGAGGKATVRWIEPLEIVEIITDPDDRESVMLYKRTWTDAQGTVHDTYYRSATNMADKPAKDARGTERESTDWGIVFHLAINTLGQRGNPQMLSALDWLRQYRKFLASRVAMMLALTRFAWKLKVLGGQAAVDAQGSKLSVADGAPEAGSTSLENEGANLSPVRTDTGARNAETDGKMLKLQVFAAAGFPETYYGDVDAGNLATAKTAELPVIKMIQSRQQIWEGLWEDIDNLVLGHNGIGPDKWYVDRNWPPIAPKDAVAFAEALSKTVGTFPQLADARAVIQAALASLGIDDTDEVLDDLKKVVSQTQQEEEAKANPDAEVVRLCHALTQYLEGRQDGHD